jgi:hypothetical protein
LPGWSVDAAEKGRFVVRVSLGCTIAVLLLSGCISQDKYSAFTYDRRPSGYQWTARPNSSTGDLAYFGVDPRTHWTVYVGPDSVYYSYPHPGDIKQSDLDSSPWNPHDADDDL